MVCDITGLTMFDRVTQTTSCTLRSLGSLSTFSIPVPMLWVAFSLRSLQPKYHVPLLCSQLLL